MHVLTSSNQKSCSFFICLRNLQGSVGITSGNGDSSSCILQFASWDERY